MSGYGHPQQPPHWGWRPLPPPPAAVSRTPVVALALAGAALFVALVALVVAVVLTSGGRGGPLTGRVAEGTATGPLEGVVLEGTVTQVISDDGGDVGRVSCPGTPSVRQGVVTVCHGQVDGEEWAFVVLFEDEDARFTLLVA